MFSTGARLFRRAGGNCVSDKTRTDLGWAQEIPPVHRPRAALVVFFYRWRNSGPYACGIPRSGPDQFGVDSHITVGTIILVRWW
jgi:hypothetical protein